MSEHGITRPEIIAILVKATLVGFVSYFGLKWAIDAMDPTAKKKKEAQEKVSSLHHFAPRAVYSLRRLFSNADVGRTSFATNWS